MKVEKVHRDVQQVKLQTSLCYAHKETTLRVEWLCWGLGNVVIRSNLYLVQGAERDLSSRHPDLSHCGSHMSFSAMVCSVLSNPILAAAILRVVAMARLEPFSHAYRGWTLL